MEREKAKLIDITGTRKEVATINAIAEKAQEILKHEHNIDITIASAIPTIAYEFLYSAAQFLNNEKSTEGDTSINIMNLIELGVTYRESDDGEKEGNFVPFIQPGTIFKTVIKSDEMTEDDE